MRDVNISQIYPATPSMHLVFGGYPGSLYNDHDHITITNHESIIRLKIIGLPKPCIKKTYCQQKTHSEHREQINYEPNFQVQLYIIYQQNTVNTIVA